VARRFIRWPARIEQFPNEDWARDRDEMRDRNEEILQRYLEKYPPD
jgi:hypothetical protein